MSEPKRRGASGRNAALDGVRALVEAETWIRQQSAETAKQAS